MEKVGYYDCVTENFLGEVDDHMKQLALWFFKESIRSGDGCALIKIESHNPHGTTLEGYKRVRLHTSTIVPIEEQ